MKTGFTPLEITGANKKHKENESLTGFTLIEFLVTISIIIVLTTFAVFNYTKGGGLALQRAVNRLSQDLRLAQEMAMSARQSSAVCGGAPSDLTGYGIYFNGGDEGYVLFADCDGDYIYVSDFDEIVENIDLEKNIEISNIEKDDLSAGSVFPSFLSVFFKPPDPIIYIEGISSGYEAKITLLSQEGDVSKQRIIKINNAGRIEIEPQQ